MRKLIIWMCSFLLVLTVMFTEIKFNVPDTGSVKSDNNQFITINLNDESIVDVKAFGLVGTLAVLAMLFCGTAYVLGQANEEDVTKYTGWASGPDPEATALYNDVNQYLIDTYQTDTSDVYLPKEYVSRIYQSNANYIKSLYGTQDVVYMENGSNIYLNYKDPVLNTFNQFNYDATSRSYIDTVTTSTTSYFAIASSFAVSFKNLQLTSDVNGKMVLTGEYYKGGLLKGYFSSKLMTQSNNTWSSFPYIPGTTIDSVTPLYRFVRKTTYTEVYPAIGVFILGKYFIPNSINLYIYTDKTYTTLISGYYWTTPGTAGYGAVTAQGENIFTTLVDSTKTLWSYDNVTGFPSNYTGDPFSSYYQIYKPIDWSDADFSQYQANPKTLEEWGLIYDALKPTPIITDFVVAMGAMIDGSKNLTFAFGWMDNAWIPPEDNLDIGGWFNTLWVYVGKLTQSVLLMFAYMLRMVIFVPLVSLFESVFGVGTFEATWILLTGILSQTLIFFNFIITSIIEVFLVKLIDLLSAITTLTGILPSPLNGIADTTLAIAGAFVGLNVIRMILNLRRL